MTYFVDRLPELRMSDVDEFIRETAMDDSDGQHVMEYIKRKRGGARIRLYDGSDNPINFRLDHLQPVPASQPNPSVTRETLAIIRSPEAASRSSVDVVQPPSPVRSADNRIASFVSPPRSTAPNTRIHSPRLATSPSMRQSNHLNPYVGLTGVMGNNPKNLQKDLLLQQYRRSNKLKCEAIRSAKNPTSSTPITGESTTRNSENFLNLRETISPIADDEVDMTPHRPLRSSNAGSRVLTPVPATQHPPQQASGTAHNECNRENTPPRDADQGIFVIPETPSPVRRSPRNASTPLSALTAARLTIAKDLTFRNEASGGAELRGLLESKNAPIVTPTRRSILKNRDSSFGSPRNRVSFSERLISVREITPTRDVPSNDLTSDESDEEREAMSVDANHLSIRDKQDKRRENRDVEQSRRQFRKSRSNALDEPNEADVVNANGPPISSDAQKEKALRAHAKAKESNRTNVNAVNMIMDDWVDSPEAPIGTNEPNGQEVVDGVAQRTINSPIQITTIDTPRSVLMDILEPPSAFGDDSSRDPTEENEPEPEPSERTSDIDPSRKRKINESPHESMEQRDTERRCNMSKLSNGRFMSTTSPHDHVPLDLIHVTDMIHSKMNSDLVEPKEPAETRTTIVLPRRSKPKPDEDTEQYFATIEKTCSENKATHRKRKQFRKLFSQEISEKEPPERETSPQPLPATQEPSVEPPPISIKPMHIVVKRLSSMTLERYTQPAEKDTDRTEQLVVGQNNGSDATKPILEKQNVERSEKVNLSKDNDDDGGDARKPSGSKSKNRREKADKQNVRKKSAKSKKAQPSPTPDDGMVQKYLKNVSNEIRQHIDSEAEGVRRSHRSKRVATGVLNANVGVPLYTMPSIDAILSYRKKRLDHTSKMPAKNARTKERKKGNENERHVEEQRSDERFDVDGFRIPSVKSKKTKEKQSSRTKDALTMTSPVGRVGCSDSDSGISTGVPTNDDAAEDTHVLPSKRPKQTPKQATASTDALPTSSSSSDPPVPDVDLAAEKRQAFDWMMMLMNDRQKRPEALPIMDMQDFAHFSLQHLYFERRDKIEYSFYVQSNGETCGFMRFQPHAEKRMSRTKNHLLKFLILSGSLKFTINKKEVDVVEGDFLILPANSTYRTINGSETTLMFMMKSSAPKR